MKAKLLGRFGQMSEDPLMVSFFIVGLPLIDIGFAFRQQGIESVLPTYVRRP